MATNQSSATPHQLQPKLESVDWAHRLTTPNGFSVVQMTASISARKLADERRQKAWDMHLRGVSHIDIATELGITHGRVSHYIKEFAQAHPVTKLDLAERLAISEARWQQSEDELRAAIAEQVHEGRVTQETVIFPDGSQQKRVTRQKGVDPALLRALSTHHDRRNRHALNQASPDQAVNQVNVAVVQDFLKQADGGKAITASDWNSSQDAPIDI